MTTPPRPAPGPPPTVLVVLGVSGSGKSTVGAMLAERLGWPFAEADAFHPAENVARMAAGEALTDEDRWPWLERVAAWIDQRIRHGESGVVACSALKRSYRDLLRQGRPGVSILYLEGSPELIAERLSRRRGHFFPAALLESQLREFEAPTPDEHPYVVPLANSAEETVARALEELRGDPPCGSDPRAR